MPGTPANWPASVLQKGGRGEGRQRAGVERRKARGRQLEHLAFARQCRGAGCKQPTQRQLATHRGQSPLADRAAQPPRTAESPAGGRRPRRRSRRRRPAAAAPAARPPPAGLHSWPPPQGCCWGTKSRPAQACEAAPGRRPSQHPLTAPPARLHRASWPQWAAGAWPTCTNEPRRLAPGAGFVGAQVRDSVSAAGAGRGPWLRPASAWSGQAGVGSRLCGRPPARAAPRRVATAAADFACGTSRRQPSPRSLPPVGRGGNWPPSCPYPCARDMMGSDRSVLHGLPQVAPAARRVSHVLAWFACDRWPGA